MKKITKHRLIGAAVAVPVCIACVTLAPAGSPNRFYLALILGALFYLIVTGLLMIGRHSERFWEETASIEAEINRTSDEAGLLRLLERIRSIEAAHHVQYAERNRLGAIVATKLAAAYRPLTDQQAASACLSYRHDFGLLPEETRQRMITECKSWHLAINKALGKA